MMILTSHMKKTRMFSGFVRHRPQARDRQARDSHGAITLGSLTMIVGGAPNSGSS